MRFANVCRGLVVLPLLLTSMALARSRRAPGLGEDNRAAAKLPAWMKAGPRISYYQARRNSGGWTGSCAGRQGELGESGDGADVFGPGDDGRRGRRDYADDRMAADERTLAVETRMFLLMDPAGGRVSSSDFGAIIGTPAGWGRTGFRRQNWRRCGK